MAFILEIPKIALNVVIGYFNEERTHSSPVEIAIWFTYKQFPSVCFHDNLDDTTENNLRYDLLIQSIIKFSENKKFYTVEKWCYEISTFVIEKYKLKSILSNFKLKFTKKNILLPEAPDGISFIFEENF
jgi:FolB domain-containing protein